MITPIIMATEFHNASPPPPVMRVTIVKENDRDHESKDQRPSPRPPLKSTKGTDRDSTCSTCSSTSTLLLEEDRPVVPGVSVRAGTLDSLIDTCIACFDARGNLQEDDDNSHFPYVFFLMHKWFATSEAVAYKLIDQFNTAETARICGDSDQHCGHTANRGGDTCDIYQQRAKICHALRYWICTFPMHFDMDKSLATVLYDFQSLVADLEHQELADLLDLSRVPSYDWMRNMSVRNPAGKLNRKVSLVFNHLEPEELAAHLTYLEHKAMRRIGFLDFKRYAQQGILGDNAKLERSIALFNGLSQWIQCMVLSKTKPQQRAEVIVKFVHVAKKLQELRNFNTLMAVVGGLSHSALARLSKTLACVPPEAQKLLQDLTELLSSTSNFINYRKALSESRGFKIPILGVHMKDLISLNVALNDTIEDDVINFRKMAQLSLIFQELNQLQNSNSPIEVSEDLVNTLRLSLDLAYTEDEIYELSLAREPRNSFSPQSSPTKPAVFAEWAAGVSTPLDSETIEKHVHAMVEAVYKNYDNDHDGYISQDEFESIAGNFPFIDSFCVLDADKDGMISKDEMQDYFVRANCHALKNGFKHDFHETTYFKPTFCAHCTGLLWGLIKQGYKCKDCGINSHKHCKDLVVMECRKQSTTSSRCNSVASSDGVVMKTKLKHWKQRQQKSNSQSEFSEPPPSPKLSTSELPCSQSPAPSDTSNSSSSAFHSEMSLQDRLLSVEEERDRLKAENEVLRSQLMAVQEEIQTLNQHMGEVRRQTVAFILRQMETLKIQKDTAV